MQVQQHAVIQCNELHPSSIKLVLSVCRTNLMLFSA